MLPFPIMNTYGNIAPKSNIRKVQTYGKPLDQTSGNAYGAILTDLNVLYGFGVYQNLWFGSSTVAQNNVQVNMYRNDVKNFWLVHGGIIVKTVSDTFLFSGQYYAGIFCSGSATATPYAASWVDVTSYFTAASGPGLDIVDFCSTGPISYGSSAAGAANPGTRGDQSILWALNSNGDVYAMGLNNSYMINGGVSAGSYILSFFKQSTISGVKAIASMPFINHNNVEQANASFWALKNDGTIWAKGFNHRGSVIPGSASTGYYTAFTQFPVGGGTVNSANKASGIYGTAEGYFYKYNNTIYICGVGGGTSPNYNYALGMGLAGTNNGNQATASHVKLTYTSLTGSTTNFISSDSTVINTLPWGTIIYNPGDSRIYAAHGRFGDAGTSAQPRFIEIDVGVPVSQACYLSATAASPSLASAISAMWGILIVDNTGQFWIRGQFGTTAYSTFTNVQLI